VVRHGGQPAEPRRPVPLAAGRRGPPLKLVKRIEAPKTPSHLSIDSKSTVVYASLQDSDELLAIDLATQAPRWKIKTGKMPADLYLTPDDRTLLVGLTGDRFVEAYDVSVSPPKLVKRIAPAKGRTPSARWATAARVRQQPRGQHHQPDRPQALAVVAELPGPAAPTAWSCWPTARRCWSARAGRASSASSTSRRARWCTRSTSAARRTACGRWTMRRGSEACWLAAALAAGRLPRRRTCDKPLYLTFDTGHMGVAPLVAEVLARQQVQGHLLPGQRTHARRRQQPGRPVGAVVEGACGRGPCLRLAHLGPRQLAGRHAHGGCACGRRMGPQAGKPRVLDAAAYCAELQRPARRFEAMTGQRMGAIFRAPGRQDLAGAAGRGQGCGWTHVGWAPAGFLGDELPSERFPNDATAGQRRCATSAPATSCWRTWASGRAATPGRRRCWSR
jgi:hypothetical protein